MSSIRCRCGARIADNEDSLPYKGHVMRDRDWDDFLNWEFEAADYLKAVSAGKRSEWITERFGSQYPQEMDDREVINDIITSSTYMKYLNIFQCTACGRLWLQRPGLQKFLSFRPEDEDWQDAL